MTWTGKGDVVSAGAVAPVRLAYVGEPASWGRGRCTLTRLGVHPGLTMLIGPGGTRRISCRGCILERQLDAGCDSQSIMPARVDLSESAMGKATCELRSLRNQTKKRISHELRT